ncbi:hypothetical protein A966_05151 [Brachyspira hampsonii 30446]|uniref:DUF2157 domain-containing protein n=1 Tax=Brachyspira hampsonii 30446 TaxID=1289135 RepID=A0A2U4F4H7_9SPIR|nr:DUF2157 domain-containing protein [Brachyspira hampsonii]EKV57507.1 hypothetical protein A966_05151 [Brachyspira hampsonii 30446]OEJ20488.1 DUF2157 domain-containing protein [Brachyspira hampsonii]
MGSKNRFLLKELKKWNKDNIITNEQFEILSKMYRDNYIDWQPIIKAIMITGIIMVAIGFIAFISFYIFSLYFIAFLFAFLFLLGFIIDEILKRKDIYLPKTSSAIIAISSIFLSAFIFTLSYIITHNKDNFILLSLISIILFFIIAYIKKNYAVLSIAIIGLITWYGFEGFDISGIDFTLNNYIRFIITSILMFLIGITDINKKIGDRYSNFSIIYYTVGILYLNMILSIMSIFGNNADPIIFEYGSSELLIYSLLFLFIDIIIFVIGYKLKNSLIVGYSIFFIILNLYIRYFEYFYLKMNAWIFFIILGLSTILIGVIIERIIKYK